MSAPELRPNAGPRNIGRSCWAGWLLERGDLRMVLVGGAQDVARARQITGGLAWPNLADWTGRLSIAELAAVTERAAVFVGADSGPAHLAAAVHAPVVVLFSGTNDARVWKPVGSEVTVLQQQVACGGCRCRQCPLVDHPCMQGLQPERVTQAILHMLQLQRSNLIWGLYYPTGWRGPSANGAVAMADRLSIARFSTDSVADDSAHLGSPSPADIAPVAMVGRQLAARSQRRLSGGACWLGDVIPVACQRRNRYTRKSSPSVSTVNCARHSLAAG